VLVEQFLLELFQLHIELENRLLTDLAVEVHVRTLDLYKLDAILARRQVRHFFREASVFAFILRNGLKWFSVSRS
jgi:hypothetical protein